MPGAGTGSSPSSRPPPSARGAGTRLPLPISTIADRVRAIRDASADAGVEYEFITGAMSPQQTRDVVSELVKRPDRPSVLIMSYSRLALPAFQAIREAGLGIPEDVSLVCLDDADWMTASTPGVSVIAIPAYDLGARAAGVLLNCIAGAGRKARTTCCRPQFRTLLGGRSASGPTAGGSGLAARAPPSRWRLRPGGPQASTRHFQVRAGPPVDADPTVT